MEKYWLDLQRSTTDLDTCSIYFISKRSTTDSARKSSSSVVGPCLYINHANERLSNLYTSIEEVGVLTWTPKLRKKESFLPKWSEMLPNTRAPTNKPTMNTALVMARKWRRSHIKSHCKIISCRTLHLIVYLLSQCTRHSAFSIGNQLLFIVYSLMEPWSSHTVQGIIALWFSLNAFFVRRFHMSMLTQRVTQLRVIS